MRHLMARAEAIAAARAARHVDALAQAAETELPGDLRVRRLDDGIGLSGPGLVQRLAFDGWLRGLALGVKARAR